jgi:hypothetical protein
MLDRPPLRRAAMGATVLMVAGLSMSQLRQARESYVQEVPLDLPGAARLRVHPNVARTLHTLTQTLRDQSDTFLCIPGFGSLYFWTGEQPPTLDVLSHVMQFYSEERQDAMLGALLEHPHPIVVHFRGLALPSPTFEEKLEKRFKPLMQIGEYQLLVPREIPGANFSKPDGRGIDPRTSRPPSSHDPGAPMYF